jgi:EF-P beta-lysylation protein EpmB
MESLTFTLDSPRASWQTVLAGAIRKPAELCRLLELPSTMAVTAEKAMAGFPLLVPRPYLSRIRRGDPNDPLLLQVLPQEQELTPVPQFTTDPLGETEILCGPGVLQKYCGRLLIVAIGSCCVHCRFCFRRHFPYPAPFPTSAIREILADATIQEVILSGGDPLMLDDRRLAQLVRQLAEIPHLRRLRVHTRLPVMIPQRVTNELIAALRGTRLTPIFVNHINHPAEIDAEVAEALGRLADAGIVVLNQAVLLRGVNDRAEVLADLCRRLIDLRVLPYYLHQLDRVAGAAHFEVPEAEGLRLVAQLRGLLPGYAVPRYVRETPGGASKEILA